MAKIGIQDCRFFAHHGYYDSEKKEGNTFELNLTVEYDVSKAAETDNLDLGLNYEGLYAVLKNVMEGASVNLLEHLAQKIINQIEAKYPAVLSIKIKIAKLNPPIAGKMKSVWVELEK